MLTNPRIAAQKNCFRLKQTVRLINSWAPFEKHWHVLLGYLQAAQKISEKYSDMRQNAADPASGVSAKPFCGALNNLEACLVHTIYLDGEAREDGMRGSLPL